MVAPLILLTNDDGIDSPGLHAAVEAVADLGDVLIVAPHTQQTSMGRAMPVGAQVGVIGERVIEAGGREYRAFAVHGSPAQAALHALHEIAERRPALCICGVNYGENLGASITRSGTVGAALEAASQRIPALAISLEVLREFHYATEYAVVDWTAAQRVTRTIAERILSKGLPSGVDLLNIAVPATATSATPLRATRQSCQNYYDERKPPTRDFSGPYRFVSHVAYDTATLEPESDILAFAIDRVISVTPLSLDLTARSAFAPWLDGDQPR